jgi:hypothetical protein
LSNGIPGPSATSFLDYDSTPGHELGHNFGRHHTWEPDCRAGTGCSDFWWGACPSGFEQFPYDDGQLGPSEYEWLGTTIFGFSSYLNTNAVMYYPNVKDTMTYCGRWMSDFTFRRIRSAMGPDTLNTIEKSRRKESSPAATGDFLVVSGTISDEPGKINLSPIFVLPEIAYNFEAQRGPFEIVLKNAKGAELASYPFNPDVGWDSQSSLGLNDPVPPPSATFFEIIPYHADATSLGIVWKGTFLEGIQAGITPPTVNLLYPNGREILDTDPITVTWTAGDPEERDALDYRISYSKDNGTTWDLVASGITETQVTIPRANLPATRRGLFRVWASDGIHTGFDDSDDTFIVPNAPPYLEITSPISGTIFVISQTVTFQANAYDPDSGSMDGEQIVWFSTIDGEIGNGDLLSLSDLSAGEHTILAVAVDGKGGMAGDSVKITIYQDAQHLPRLPGVLAVSPGGIYFKPSHGIISQELEVYNAHLGESIPWQAVPCESWIKISPAMASGRTRSWITVTVDTSGLDFGRYLGAILFSNLENPRDRVVLPVELVYTPETVYLPLVIR